MANPIVLVSVTQTVAPAPNTLQKSGAFISQGGTTTTPGTLTALTSVASLATILTGSKAVTSITQTGGLATVTAGAAHGIPIGDVVPVTIMGSTITAYNGTFNATATTTTAFTYAIAAGTATPATGTILYTLEDVAELNAMNTTFFAQPGIKAVYVLELGPGAATDGTAALSTYITAHPGVIYSWLVPTEWDNNAAFLTFARTFTAPNARTYFWVTTTVANEAVYAGIKSVLAFAPATTPTAPLSEFGMAAPFASTLGWNPSSTQQVPPLEYCFLYGVTAWSPFGTQTTTTGLTNANVNWAGPASEGGLSNVCLFVGETSDGLPFNYWYAVDYVAINAQLALANEVENGSNAQPYLYYSQGGINRLQARLAQVANQAVSYGLAVGKVVLTQLPYATFALNSANGLYAGQVVINAEPFSVYTAENPNDYAAGKYGGLAMSFAPARGFDQILVSLNATQFVS